MSKRTPDNKGRSRAPSAPSWKGQESLILVHRLNQRALLAVAELAQSTQPSEVPTLINDRALWAALDPQAIQRLTRLPFVLLDAHFSSEHTWRTITYPPAPTSTPPLAQPWLPPTANALMTELLIFAWHAVRADRRLPRLLLGMAPAVMESIAALMPEHLTSLATLCSGNLRLRWQDHSDLWRHALLTAQSGDASALAEVHLHTQLLYCSELMPSCP
jgi:hypothetical protein